MDVLWQGRWDTGMGFSGDLRANVPGASRFHVTRECRLVCRHSCMLASLVSQRYLTPIAESRGIGRLISGPGGALGCPTDAVGISDVAAGLNALMSSDIDQGRLHAGCLYKGRTIRGGAGVAGDVGLKRDHRAIGGMGPGALASGRVAYGDRSR